MNEPKTMGKTLTELARELELVCAQIQAEPEMANRIMKCATVTYLAEHMQFLCSQALRDSGDWAKHSHWVPKNLDHNEEELLKETLT